MIYFFDTSALQHRYVDTPKSRIVRRIISDSRNTCYVSDLTVLEIASAFGKRCRTNRWSVTTYAKLDRAFWRDLHRGKIQVRNATIRDYLRARHLLKYAGVKRARNIASGDALIAASCLECALEMKASVKFCLEDWTLYSVIRDISAYNKVLDFKYIGVDKNPP